MRRVIHVQHTLKDRKTATGGRLAAKSNRWDEHCSIGQTSEYKNVKGDALIVGPATRKVGHEFLVMRA